VFVKIFTNQDIWGCGEGVDAIPGTYHLVKNFARLKEKNPLNVHRLLKIFVGQVFSREHNLACM
jgi:galactonate dehydratase